MDEQAGGVVEVRPGQQPHGLGVRRGGFHAVDDEGARHGVRVLEDADVADLAHESVVARHVRARGQHVADAEQVERPREVEFDDGALRARPAEQRLEGQRLERGETAGGRDAPDQVGVRRDAVERVGVERRLERPALGEGVLGGPGAAIGRVVVAVAQDAAGRQVGQRAGKGRGAGVEGGGGHRGEVGAGGGQFGEDEDAPADRDEPAGSQSPLPQKQQAAAGQQGAAQPRHVGREGGVQVAPDLLQFVGRQERQGGAERGAVHPEEPPLRERDEQQADERQPARAEHGDERPAPHARPVRLPQQRLQPHAGQQRGRERQHVGEPRREARRAEERQPADDVVERTVEAEREDEGEEPESEEEECAPAAVRPGADDGQHQHAGAEVDRYLAVEPRVGAAPVAAHARAAEGVGQQQRQQVAGHAGAHPGQSAGAAGQAHQLQRGQ